ncbi:MAG: hypothetical protein WCX22_04905 [Methanoregula sp.]
MNLKNKNSDAHKNILENLFGSLMKKFRTLHLITSNDHPNTGPSPKSTPWHHLFILTQGLDPENARKMPGLANGAFLENPEMGPDSIRARM